MPRRDRLPPGLDQKDITRLRILDCIRAAGQISRLDIATALAISPATVTSTTADLLSADLITEVEAETNRNAPRRGRPRVMLKLNGAAHIVAGIKVARNVLSVLLMNFEGLELGSYEHRLDKVCLPAPDLVRTLREAVEMACKRANLSLDALSGISIGMPGQINAETRFVHWSSSLTERNVDLAPLLDRELPCPSFVENDTNLVAKAEQLFGDARDLTDFLVVTIEHGVGLGIVLDGHLYRGTRGCGAEFGHMKVQLDGALCQCGQRGCLEAYVGDYALIREAALAGNDSAPKSVSEILENARHGNAIATSVLQRSGQMFAVGLANLINLFDPERIVLSGTQFNFDHLHSEEVMSRIQRSVVNADAALPEIRVHHWGDLTWAKGAAGYAIEQVSILSVKHVTADAA